MKDDSKEVTPLSVVRHDISVRSAVVVLLTATVFWLLGQLIPILVVVVCALILVGTFTPSIRWLEARGVKRLWSSVIIFGGCAVIGGLIGLIILPPIGDELKDMMSHLPAWQSGLADRLAQHPFSAPLAGAVRNFRTLKAASAIDVNSAVTLSMSALLVIGYAATAVVLAVYFIVDHERMRGYMFALVPRRYHVRLARVLVGLEPIVGGYMRGQGVTSVAIGLFAFALLFFCKVPHALAFAAIAAVTDIIPFVGGLLATTPAVLASLSRGTTVAVIVLLFMVAYQEFESRVIVPAVYGKVLRLPPAIVIIALLVGGKIGGIIGALLALPLAAAILMIIAEVRLDLPGSDYHDPQLQRRDDKDERTYALDSRGKNAEESAAIASRIAASHPLAQEDR